MNNIAFRCNTLLFNPAPGGDNVRTGKRRLGYPTWLLDSMQVLPTSSLSHLNIVHPTLFDFQHDGGDKSESKGYRS